MRKGEILMLLKENVNLTDTKNGEVRDIPLSAMLTTVQKRL